MPEGGCNAPRDSKDSGDIPPRANPLGRRSPPFASEVDPTDRRHRAAVASQKPERFLTQQGGQLLDDLVD